jgi:hypothetical protein
MAAGEVDLILVGADRVAANGDTANKVGTYTLAVLAERHGIPFYVCAPTSSVDLETPDGSAIPIEERSPDEVLEFRGVRVAPPGTDVRNPAFDITPADLITGFITEEGVVRAPFDSGLRDASERAGARWAAAPGFRPIVRLAPDDAASDVESVTKESAAPGEATVPTAETAQAPVPTAETAQTPVPTAETTKTSADTPVEAG